MARFYGEEKKMESNVSMTLKPENGIMTALEIESRMPRRWFNFLELPDTDIIKVYE